MSVMTGDLVTMGFTTTNPATGAAWDADTLPAGVLLIDSVISAEVVTIADAAGTGKYTFSVTMPELTIGQRVQVIVSATIGGVVCSGVVWEDQEISDIIANIAAAILVTPANKLATEAAGAVTRVINLTNLPAAAALEATLTAMKGAGWTYETLRNIYAALVGLTTQLPFLISESMIRDDQGYAVSDIISGSMVDILRDAVSGASIDPQDIANAALLAPVGVAAAGSQMDYLADMPANVDAQLSGTHGAGGWEGGAGGVGTVPFQYLVDDVAHNPIAGARVIVTTDLAGLNIYDERYTDAFGIATFHLVPGTWYFWPHRVGYAYDDGILPDVEVVV